MCEYVWVLEVCFSCCCCYCKLSVVSWSFHREWLWECVLLFKELNFSSCESLWQNASSDLSVSRFERKSNLTSLRAIGCVFYFLPISILYFESVYIMCFNVYIYESVSGSLLSNITRNTPYTWNGALCNDLVLNSKRLLTCIRLRKRTKSTNIT